MTANAKIRAVCLAAALAASPACLGAAPPGAGETLESGIRKYKSGHLLEAMDDFLAVLAQDPSNDLAKQYIWSIGKGLRARRKSLYPSDEERRQWVADAQRRLGLKSRKVEEAMRALAKDFDQVRSSSQPATALAFLDAADPLVQQDPELAPVLTARAEGLFQQAYGDLRKIIAKQAFASSDELLKAQGYLAYYENRWPEAVRLWQASLRDNPGDEALQRMVKRVTAALAQRRQSQEVARLAEQADIYAQSELYDDAIASWQEALRWQPDHPRARQELERLTQLKARKERQRLAKEHFARGIALYKQSRYVEAIQSWIEALSLDPGDPQSRRWLEVAGKRLNASVEAPAFAGPAAKSAANKDVRRAKDIYREALIRYSQGDILEAKRLLEETLRLDPEHEQARRALQRIETDLAAPK